MRACLEVTVGRPEIWVAPQRSAAVVVGLVDGVSLQLTFDPETFSVAEAAPFCDDALGRDLARRRHEP